MTSDKQTVVVPREPTEEMVEAGADALFSEIERQTDRLSKQPKDYYARVFDKRQLALLAHQAMIAAAPASPSLGERREEVARMIDGLAFGVTGDPATDDRRSVQRDMAFAKADRIIALLSRPEGHQDGRGGG